MNLSELKGKVCDKKYKIISFDIFDTLLLRPCVLPIEILKLAGRRCGLEGDFLTMRVTAEKAARKGRPFLEDEITLDDIYVKFKELFDFTDEEILRFKSCEMEVEYQYLIPRRSMLEVFNCAKNNGKKIIIVSDMYLSTQFLDKVLHKCGYFGYEKLYVSSDLKSSKKTGKLYEIVKSDYVNSGIKPNEILHLGDNQKTDIETAQAHGLSAEWIPRVEWMFRKNSKLFSLYNYVESFCDNTFLIGWSIAQIFDDPFVQLNGGSYFSGKKENMSLFLLAPMMLAYLKNTLGEIMQMGIGVLYFLEGTSDYIGRIIDLIAKEDIIQRKVFCLEDSKLKEEKMLAFLGRESDIDRLHDLSNEELRFYSFYISSLQVMKHKNINCRAGMIYGFDTNRDVPIMNDFINLLAFDQWQGEVIDDMRETILNYVRGFTRTFIYDFEHLFFDFTNYNEFYMYFLADADHADRQILKDIDVNSGTLYSDKEINLYKVWSKAKENAPEKVKNI